MTYDCSEAEDDFGERKEDLTSAERMELQRLRKWYDECVGIIIKDKVRLDWLEENLRYAMVRLPGRANMDSLPNEGKGWHNGELRKAIDAQLNR